MHCGDQRHLGLCLGYVPALAYGSCRVSDQGTTLRASDLHNARATILNPFNIISVCDVSSVYTAPSVPDLRFPFHNDTHMNTTYDTCSANEILDAPLQCRVMCNLVIIIWLFMAWVPLSRMLYIPVRLYGAHIIHCNLNRFSVSYRYQMSLVKMK